MPFAFCVFTSADTFDYFVLFFALFFCSALLFIRPCTRAVVSPQFYSLSTQLKCLIVLIRSLKLSRLSSVILQFSRV